MYPADCLSEVRETLTARFTGDRERTDDIGRCDLSELRIYNQGMLGSSASHECNKTDSMCLVIPRRRKGPHSRSRCQNPVFAIMRTGGQGSGGVELGEDNFPNAPGVLAFAYREKDTSI